MVMEVKPEERGQSLVEYAFLLVLIVIVVVLVLTLVGDAIYNLWDDAILPILEAFGG
jgi:Flp pilus assembly pilin Flp